MVRNTIRRSEKNNVDTPYPVLRGSPDDLSTEAVGHVLQERSVPDFIGELPGPDYVADSADATTAWATLSRETRIESLPPTLRIGEGRVGQRPRVDTIESKDTLGSSLQAGSTNFTPRSSLESQRSTRSPEKPAHIDDPSLSPKVSSPLPLNSNNPFLRMTDTDNDTAKEANLNLESSTNIWSPAAEPPLQKLSISDNDPAPGFGHEKKPFSEPWVDFAASPVQEKTELSPISSQLPINKRFSPPVAYKDMGVNPFREPDIKEDLKSETNKVIPYQGSEIHKPEGKPENVNTIDQGLSALPPRGEILNPDLPPRPPIKEKDEATSQPPKPQPEHHKPGETPEMHAHLEMQRNETYQIRLVNWFDDSSPTNPRRSPIMVQNANGPCPLLALVNALTLSTPAGLETPLLETLRVREHISLGLLLDAVFEELMSGRRGDAAQNLPDVSDLYTFLVTLHTGMNINPLFVSSEARATCILDEPIETNVHASSRLGKFEDTKEMRLYSTFAVPLIHGWVPPMNHPVFYALQRSARTYEEAQNLMFREEELEEKLQQQGLNEDEQLMLEDVGSVKYFLSSSATQLTPCGLEIMTQTLGPGSIAILFRNDHFSTLYKHPYSGQLFTLVTDLGYAGHDEIVWESLVDVTGEGCEFFAGDFRPVGNGAGGVSRSSSSANANDNGGWTTVTRLNNGRPRNPVPLNSADALSIAPLQSFSALSLDESTLTPSSPTTEQEDHDLALAMQLQEEEEDRERRAIAARRRENELSQAYVNSQSTSNRRGARRASGHSFRGSAAREREIRPTNPSQVAPPSPRKAEGNGDAPPPTYEQAAKGPAYHPPTNHPQAQSELPEENNVARAQDTSVRQSSAYSENSSAGAGIFVAGQSASWNSPASANFPARGRGRGREGRARSSQTGVYRGERPREGAGSVGDEKSCIVM